MRFTRITASNIASDDVTNWVTHRIFNTDLRYSCVHFVVKIDEKFSLNDGFYYDLMMILDSGLLFWATLYNLQRRQVGTLENILTETFYSLPA